MSIAEVVASYADSPDGSREQRYLPAAGPLVGGLSAALPVESGDAGLARDVLVLDLAQRGAEAAAIAALADLIGEHGVAVLTLAAPPEELPVGPVLQATSRAGVRVLQAEGLSSRHGRTILVLTRDPSIPQRSYLLGESLPESDATRLRQANEWAVEGLQLRAASGVTAAQLKGAREEARLLRIERDELAAAWSVERKRLNARITGLLEAPGPLRSGLRHMKKAATLVSQDAVGGSKRVAKAAVRKAGR